MLPKQHPLNKTYVDLRRCEGRIDEYLTRYSGEESDLCIKLLDVIKQAKELIPNNHK